MYKKICPVAIYLLAAVYLLRSALIFIVKSDYPKSEVVIYYTIKKIQKKKHARNPKLCQTLR